MKRLKDKKIIITGGSMGIGLAVAQRCAQEGAQLILVSRHSKDLKKAVQSLNGYDQKHSYYCLDVSKLFQVKEMAKVIKRKLGFIDGLVNCAGVYGPIGTSDKIDIKKFIETIHINLLGTFYMCHHFIPLFIKGHWGKIVNYSGGGGASPFPNFSAYATSKAGIVRLSENLALEFKKENIDINVIAPGFVVTRFHQETIKAGQRAGADFLKNTIEQIEKGGVPADRAAALTAFLLSPDSDGITGKFISASWDSWEDSHFQAKLKNDKDFATLRRIDDKTFFKKG